LLAFISPTRRGCRSAAGSSINIRFGRTARVRIARAANPSQIGLPERRGIALGLHGVGNAHQQRSSKTRPAGRICPARILHRHHDGAKPAIFCDGRRLAQPPRRRQREASASRNAASSRVAPRRLNCRRLCHFRRPAQAAFRSSCCEPAAIGGLRTTKKLDKR
jgi:hypothetical protein